jgi:uncharacterized protein
MKQAPSTVIDLPRLSLSSGEGARMDFPVPLEPFELGGQTYGPRPDTVDARIDVSRQSSGYAFRLRFPFRVEGPCMRCLADAGADAEVDAREVDQHDTEDEELHSPYVESDELDVGRWARDAAALAMPSQILCRPDCAGLCAVCGEPLNDADPAEHRHDTGPDPRWAALDRLKGS